MAEGPVVHYYAKRLAKILEGKAVHVKFRVRKLKAVESELQQVRVEKVEAHGKQFRIHFSDDRILLVHLMMWGSWKIYRKGNTWDRPHERARLILRTNTHEVVAFSAPVVAVFARAELENTSRWGNLGPDPLREDFSKEEFLRRLDGNCSREIGEAILDQQVIAGIGNILKNEILFRARIHPRRLVSRLSETEKGDLLEWIVKLPQDWLSEMVRKRRRSWIYVYQKSGKPCPLCSDTIQFFRQAGRTTYACPTCQQ